MNNVSKLMFYYEPAGRNPYTRSYTLSFSRLDPESNTYKQKAILQHWSDKRGNLEEYKLKEVHIGVDKLLEKIEKIDFDKKYSAPESGKETIYIYYGDRKIETSNVEEVRDILDMFDFFELYSITHRHYSDIKDMNEYIALKKTFDEKVQELSPEMQMNAIKVFRDNNPYKTFQSIANLNDYIQFMLSK
jgi:hypothetical protein